MDIWKKSKNPIELELVVVKYVVQNICLCVGKKWKKKKRCGNGVHLVEEKKRSLPIDARPLSASPCAFFLLSYLMTYLLTKRLFELSLRVQTCH